MNHIIYNIVSMELLGYNWSYLTQTHCTFENHKKPVLSRNLEIFIKFSTLDICVVPNGLINISNRDIKTYTETHECIFHAYGHLNIGRKSIIQEKLITQVVSCSCYDFLELSWIYHNFTKLDVIILYWTLCTLYIHFICVVLI